MSLTAEDRERRRTAKRTNEQLKFAATFLNNLAAGTLVGAVLVPIASEKVLSLHILSVWIPVACVLHSLVQLLLRLFYQSED